MQLQSLSDAFAILGIKQPKTLTPEKKAEIIYQAACKVLKLDPDAVPDVTNVRPKSRPGIIALHKLEIVRDAVVGDWVANWDNGEYKYSPWHWLDKPGFRFVGSGYAVDYAGTAGGSRLCFQTKAQSDWIGKDCIAFYADLNGAKLPVKKAA